MRPLLRAIAGIPRPYLSDRAKGLIFSPAALERLFSKFLEEASCTGCGSPRQRPEDRRVVRIAVS
jgi:hypothetical protein